MANVASAHGANTNPLAGSTYSKYPANAQFIVKNLCDAEDRFKSLTEMLEVSGAQLVTTTSFDFEKYRQARSDLGCLQGVVVQNDSLRPIRLPKAASAVPEDTSHACLRAVSATLLCFYSIEATTQILQKLLPQTLVQETSGNAGIQINGDLLLKLREWVKSVEIEEENDSTRENLHRRIDEYKFCPSEFRFEDLVNRDGGQHNELQYVAGVLEWALLPQFLRKSLRYHTRSVCAWSTAFILSTLGFDVHPADCIAANESLAKDQTRSPEVVLIHEAGNYTDELAFGSDIKEDYSKPRVLPMSKIPALIFRHLEGAPYHLNTGELHNIWLDSFHRTRNLYEGQEVEPGGDTPNTRIKFIHTETPTTELYQRLLGLFNEKDGSALPMCSELIFDRVNLTGGTEFWSFDWIEEYLTKETLSFHDPGVLRQVKRNVYILKAIVSGSIHGLCSKGLVTEGHTEAEQSQRALQTKVAVYPDLVRPYMLSRMKSWATSIYVGITFGANHAELPSKPWTDLLNEVLLVSNDQAEPESETSLDIGARQHGLTMLVDFAVRPSLKPQAFFGVHLMPGLPITLPTDQNGKFKLSPVTPLRSNKPVWSKSILSSIHAEPEQNRGPLFRLSVEPDRDDGKEITFTIRRATSPLMMNINIPHLARCLIPRHLCKCKKRVSEVQPKTNTWRQITIDVLIKMAPWVPNFRTAQNESPPDIFIDASISADATILAVGMLDQIDLVEIAWDCLTCSLEKLDSLKRLRQNSSRALIIPHGFEGRIQSHETLVPDPIPL